MIAQPTILGSVYSKFLTDHEFIELISAPKINIKRSVQELQNF